jgi:hypothetical protein
MRCLITLQLSPPNNTLDYIRGLPGLSDLAIDESYGLVAISPKRGLYVVRVSGDLDEAALSAVTEVRGVHGDVRIAPIDPTAAHSED